MGVDKHDSKSGGGYAGGLLQLFDWNGKSRKKLFSTKSDMPEGSKQGKRSNRNLPMTRYPMIDDDDNGGYSVKGSSDYSCASSVTDEEGHGPRAPSVVARLMGLDSLPTSNVIEPCSDQFFDTRSLESAPCYRRITESYNLNRGTASDIQPTKLESVSRNSLEPKAQKMQSRPFERFQTETLPPKSAKSVPITHNKLLSPIRSPGFRTSKNAAHIMEAAAKIIEPRTQINTKGKTPSLRSASVPVKVRDLKDRMESAQRPSSSHFEVSRRTVDSNALKHLKGQSLNKSWNGSEETPKFRSSPDSEVISSGHLTSKGKSISLAIQAKVNVQRREGLSGRTSRISLVQKEQPECKSNQPPKSKLKSQKNMPRKSSSQIASGVLRQNNQKQNCPTNKGKLNSKPSAVNNTGGKTMSGNSLSRNKVSNQVPGNCRTGSSKAGSRTNCIEREAPLSRRKNLPQKSGPTEGGCQYKRGNFVEANSDYEDEKSIRHNLAQDGQPKWTEDERRKGMDVVSFTFTSPMIKPTHAFQSPRQLVEKNNRFCENSRSKVSTSDSRHAKLTSVGVNVIGGDALSILLEQKLKELANRGGSTCGNSVNSSSVTSSSILQGLVSAMNAESTILRDRNKRSQLHTEKLSVPDDSDSSSSYAQMFEMNHSIQGSCVTDECSSSNSEAKKEVDQRHPSPMSIFEPSFSYESVSSSNSAHGSQQCSSTQTEQTVDTTCQSELSDSASSTLSTSLSLGKEHVSRFSMEDNTRSNNWKMEYVREVLSNVELMFKDFSLGRAREIINPHLFHQLENRKTKIRSHEENKNDSVMRKELFDCVSECLDFRCRRYVGGSWKTWAKGVEMVRRKEWLAEDVYKEISGWGSMGDWMVDELVDKEMSTWYGRWLDYDIEQSEVGLDIERSILNSLINEVVADIFVG